MSEPVLASGAVVVRERTPADLVGTVPVLARVHERDPYPVRWPADPPGWLTPATMLTAWVARAGHVVVGHIALVGVPEPAAASLVAATGRPAQRQAGIARLFVDPDWRGQGVASRLLHHAVSASWDRDLHPVLDVVAQDRDAIALYERHGWQRAGSRRAADGPRGRRTTGGIR